MHRLIPILAAALSCAACDTAPAPADQPVPPATTQTDLTGPVNESAGDATAIPVVPDPPAP